MRRAATVSLGFFLLAALLATCSAAAALRLDPSFGRRGHVRLPPSAASGASSSEVVAAEPDGALLIATSDTLRRLAPSGRFDRSFGDRGVVSLPPPTVGEAELVEATVDSQGRIVVVETSTPPQPEGARVPVGVAPGQQTEEPPRNALRVLRYLSGGTLDPSFGVGGIVETDLGLPTPVFDGGALASGPVLRVEGVTTAPGGQIVIAGSALSGAATECERYVESYQFTSTAFVARLTSSGALDTGFGGGDAVFGGHSIAEIPLAMEAAAWPVVTADGGVIFQRGFGECARRPGRLGFVRLTASGSVRGSSGRISGLGVEDVAVAPGGSIMLLLSELSRRGHDFVEKLRPNGSIDRSFGTAGRAVVPFPAGDSASRLRVGPEGEPAILGIREPRLPAKTEQKFYEEESVLLAGLHPSGRVDQRFGPRGFRIIHTPHFDGYAGLWFESTERPTIASYSYSRGGNASGLTLLRFDLEGSN